MSFIVSKKYRKYKPKNFKSYSNEGTTFHQNVQRVIAKN